MSHHYSGPNVGFPRGDARLDLTDLYAFPKPGDPAKSTFIMNFHPSVSLQPQAPTTSEPFAPEARYELRIDTDGDAVPNITYQVRLSSLQGGKQSATLRRFEGAQAETGGKVIAEAGPVSTGHEAHATQAGDHRFFAGWRSDPFFFDVLGVLNNFQFTTGDFFADKDICNRAGSAQLAAWAESRWHMGPHADSGGWCGRLGTGGSRRPPQSASFLFGDHNDAYLAAEPADDARFVPVFAHSLEHTGGYTPEAAKQTAAKLLPDVLHYDPKRPARFPDNGRALKDDVSDIFLGILTNGKVTGDKVGPHNDLLAEFPYLGPPHTIRDK
jgi:hypothetical protein